MFTWKDVLDNVQHYTNSPKLTNELTQADVDAILYTAIDFDYGSCSVCLIGVDYVFYLTQCPAKYFHSQVCHKYPNDVLQITPVGSYTFKENWFNVYIAPKVQIINDWNYDLQGEIGEDNRQFVMHKKESSHNHSKIIQFTSELRNIIGENAYSDYEFFNFAWQNGQLLAVDTVRFA